METMGNSHEIWGKVSLWCWSGAGPERLQEAALEVLTIWREDFHQPVLMDLSWAVVRTRDPRMGTPIQDRTWLQGCPVPAPLPFVSAAFPQAPGLALPAHTEGDAVLLPHRSPQAHRRKEENTSWFKRLSAAADSSLYLQQCQVSILSQLLQILHSRGSFNYSHQGRRAVQRELIKQWLLII